MMVGGTLPLTAIKFMLDSVAMAFAIMVLLQPGGPYIKIPCDVMSRDVQDIYKALQIMEAHLRGLNAHACKGFRV